MSGTHYGLQRQCSAKVTVRSASVEKPPKERHFHLAGVIWLINVGGASIEESTAAAAAEQMPKEESEDAASSADILRKLRMTAPLTTSSDTVNNRSKASGKSGKHQPSAPSSLYTSEKVTPTSLGMSLFLDAPFPTGTDRCCSAWLGYNGDYHQLRRDILIPPVWSTN